MNIPNLLTVLRFLIIPAFGYYLFIQDYSIATALFLLAGLTDVLDGYIARKFNIVTSFGKLMDPVADKLVQITALVVLVYLHKVPLFLFLIVLAKEAMMIVGSALLYKKENHVVQASWYGKVATVVFYLAIIMCIFNVPFSTWVLGGAVILTLHALIRYMGHYRQIRKSE